MILEEFIAWRDRKIDKDKRFKRSILMAWQTGSQGGTTMASQDPSKLVSKNASEPHASIDPEYPPDQHEVNKKDPTEETAVRVKPKLGDAKAEDLDYPKGKRG